MAPPPVTTAPSAPPSEKATTRVRFPLWAKLGLAFGGLVGVVISVVGIVGFDSDVTAERERRRAEMVGLARALAAGIDGDLHATFTHARDMERPEFRRYRDWLHETIEVTGVDWIGTSATEGDLRYHFVVDGGGGSPPPVGYPIFDGVAERRRAFADEVVFSSDYEDEWGRWSVALAPIHDANSEVVGLVEVADRADEQDFVVAARRDRLLLLTGAAILAAIGCAVVFARYLNRHLKTLTVTALDVADGDLDRRVEIATHDEIAVLGSAFNQMVVGLRDRDHIRETFGRYVSKEVASTVLANPVELGGELRRVTVLMSDLRGFTSLGDRVGPKEMVALLNRYFTRMAQVIEQYSGTIGELVGDGMVVFFGAPVVHADDPQRAVACAVAMQCALAAMNEEEEHELEMGIGIDTGTVIAGNIGSEKRMKYGVVGATINLAARLEGFTLGSQVLISAATYASVSAQVEVADPLEMRAKGKREPVVCYPVLAVGPPYPVRLPATGKDERLVAVDLEATLWAVRDKEVDAVERPARVRRLGRHTLELAADWTPEDRQTFKLTVRLPGGTLAEDLYGKVARVEHNKAGDATRIALHLTSVTEAAQAVLDTVGSSTEPG